MKYRKNIDEEIRRLERKIAADPTDLEASIRLRKTKQRALGRSKKNYYCITWNELFTYLGIDLEKHMDEIQTSILDNVPIECQCDCDDCDGCECSGECNTCECYYKAQDETVTYYEKEALSKITNAALNCLEESVESIERWVVRGLQMNIYDRPHRHKPGKAVDLTIFKKQLPINFDDQIACVQLYRPFLAVYAEAAYCIYGAYDEGYALKDHNLKTVIQVGRMIAECEGRKFFSLD